MSHLANESVAPHKQDQRERVLAEIKRAPGTVEELSRRLRMPYTTVSGRVSELKAEQKVWAIGRRPTSTGHQASVLEAVTAEERKRLLEPVPQRKVFHRQGSLFA